MAAPAAPSAAPPTAPAPAPPFKTRAVVAAERWRGATSPTDAAGALKRFYEAIEAPSELDSPEAESTDEVVDALDALQKAALLFTLAADPTAGLLGELFHVKESGVPLAILKALGADAAERAKSVDKELARFLRSAVKKPGEALARLARVPRQLRTLLALRFFALSGFDFCLAAENVQTGLETVLSDEVLEACDGESGDRDNSVDEFGVAMDLLRETVPKPEVLQRALDAALGHHRMPAECLQALEDMTDDGVCPDLSWLHELEAPDEEKDEGEDEE